MKTIILSAICAAWLCASAHGQTTAKSNDPNSVSYTADGTHYRLICVGDKVPQLFVNNMEIPAARLNDYTAIVAKLQAELFARQKTEAGKLSAENEKQLNQIVNDLVASKIVQSAGSLVSFRLDRGGFVVNGQKQSFAVFCRFKSKYALTGDQVYSFNEK